jgi:hypothetical protein
MHCCLSTRLIAVCAALAALPVVLAAAAPAVLGPPTVCHPIDIGTAKSLPWGSAPFAASPDYDVARTVDDTLAILRDSPDTLVHMETLRRAVIYLTPLSDAGKAKSEAWREAEIARLLAALQGDVSKCTPSAAGAKADAKDAPAAKSEHACAATATAADPALGLRTFDVGYLQAVLWQSERSGSGDARAELAAEMRGWLDKAAALRPDDGALHLGVALATYEGQDSPGCYAHLDKAVAAATDPDGLLRRNLMSTMGKFLGASSYDDLVAKVGAHVKRA